mmetsp:Transcript_5008/g.8703  ORF Transcript_5008/g.8703 Transcript_5008/m.8703 type:complete len:208 (+) Transcript_5008:113-736(+)
MIVWLLVVLITCVIGYIVHYIVSDTTEYIVSDKADSSTNKRSSRKKGKSSKEVSGRNTAVQNEIGKGSSAKTEEIITRKDENNQYSSVNVADPGSDLVVKSREVVDFDDDESDASVEEHRTMKVSDIVLPVGKVIDIGALQKQNQLEGWKSVAVQNPRKNTGSTQNSISQVSKSGYSAPSEVSKRSKRRAKTREEQEYIREYERSHL